MISIILEPRIFPTESDACFFFIAETVVTSSGKDVPIATAEILIILVGTPSDAAISEGSDSKAVSYIELKKPDGKNIFGVGIDSNVNFASILGVLNAINRAELENNA